MRSARRDLTRVAVRFRSDVLILSFRSIEYLKCHKNIRVRPICEIVDPSVTLTELGLLLGGFFSLSYVSQAALHKARVSFRVSLS